MNLRIVAVLAAAFAVPAFAGMGPNRLDAANEGDWLSVTLSYSPADLSIQSLDGYDQVHLAGTDLEFNTGDPVIPVRHVRFALPVGYRAVEVKCTPSAPYVFGGKYRIYPAADPLPLSKKAEFSITREGSAYRSASPFPATFAKLIATGSKSGYPITDVSAYPLRYEPLTGKLTLYRSMQVSVRIARETRPLAQPRVRSLSSELTIRDAVQKLVDNPDEVPTAAASGLGAADASTVDYLIITAPQLTTFFQYMADWKTKKGVYTQIVTTDWIYSHYTGELAHDGADKIRQCIKDYWQNHGTIYVLLGGDVERIPYRTLNSGDNIPADLYYSDLQGTLDDNGNGTYGEYPADGGDLYSDVYVGRAPVYSGPETSNFVFKVLQYEGWPQLDLPPTDYQNKATFLGNMWDSSTDGKLLKNTIDSESFTSSWNITKLYESEGTLSRGAALAAMNAGQNFVNHCGHANSDLITTDPDYLWSGDVYNLSNGTRIIATLYSTGCDPGYFPENDCFGENFVKAPNGGGFFVGNSLAGWYYVGYPYDGLSQGFDRTFFQAALQRRYNYTPLGQIFGEHKDMRVGAAAGNGTERYCLYDLNLLGEPEMPVWKKAPSTLLMTHPSSIYAAPCSFAVHVTDSSGAPITNAKVCLWKGTEEFEVGFTTSMGNVTFHPAVASGGTLNVTATKADYFTLSDSVSVIPCYTYGTVTLANMAGSLSGRTVAFQFRTPGTQTVVATINTTLDGSGYYSAYGVPYGAYDISLKYCNWLRQTLPNQWVGGALPADFSLQNGDADGSNAVDLLDLSLVLSDFGTIGPEGDLNCDNAVNLLDLSTILSGFGLHGDS